MTMIEKMARALAKAAQMPDNAWVRYKTHASAALEALREPTMDMKLAGAAAITAQMPKEGVQADYDAAHDGWSAMIDKALEESKL